MRTIRTHTLARGRSYDDLLISSVVLSPREISREYNKARDRYAKIEAAVNIGTRPWLQISRGIFEVKGTQRRRRRARMLRHSLARSDQVGRQIRHLIPHPSHPSSTNHRRYRIRWDKTCREYHFTSWTFSLSWHDCRGNRIAL